MVARALLLTVTALALAGCGGDDDSAAISTATTPAATTTPAAATTTATTAAPPLEGASAETVRWKGEATETALLTDVRAASHDGYDRVVFEFSNAVPGYEVGYVDRPVIADGSGETVEVKGGAVLLVRMEPALDADLTRESAPSTYTGPGRFTPDTAVVVELARTGGFEAVLTWAVGVDEERPFRVTRLEAPARIVVDVARP